MYQRLTNLYKLQIIDSHLDELEELRGDLPKAVRDLEDRLKDLERIIQDKIEEKEKSIKKREENEFEMDDIFEKQKKHKAQLYSVRNNKEYDALTKEIDHADTKIKKLEMENDALSDFSKKLENEIKELAPQIDDIKADLKDKQDELKRIVKNNEREESKFREQRAAIESQVKKPDYDLYMRIRKAKAGIAVATIRRGACSGCHNVIPSQRQLEIRRNNRIFNCANCGRIIISAEISDQNN